MKKITFLGPVGATFSHDAYEALVKTYGGPTVVADGPNANCVPASNNGDIIKMVYEHGGYGAIAMETLAEGRVVEPLESFIDLLKRYKSTDECPLRVIGAIKMKISFCLMARKWFLPDSRVRILAHPKALGVCKARIAGMKLATMSVSSNGEAARLVAEDEEYAHCMALAPRSAAEKYGLMVYTEMFEDFPGEAVTTFFLLAPPEHPVAVGRENRVLIVFAAPHKPGGLARSLLPFEEEGLNLIQIHSVHVGNHTYNFAIEVEVGESQLGSFERAMTKFAGHVEKFMTFGPFEVLGR